MSWLVTTSNDEDGLCHIEEFDLATLSDDTTIVMFARKRKHIHDYDKEIFMLFEDKE